MRMKLVFESMNFLVNRSRSTIDQSFKVIVYRTVGFLSLKIKRFQSKFLDIKFFFIVHTN